MHVDSHKVSVAEETDAIEPWRTWRSSGCGAAISPSPRLRSSARCAVTSGHRDSTVTDRWLRCRRGLLGTPWQPQMPDVEQLGVLDSQQAAERGRVGAGRIDAQGLWCVSNVATSEAFAQLSDQHDRRPWAGVNEVGGVDRFSGGIDLTSMSTAGLVVDGWRVELEQGNELLKA